MFLLNDNNIMVLLHRAGNLNTRCITLPHMLSFMQHCAGVNCLAILKASPSDSCNYLFTGSRDGTLKRWSLDNDEASCSATFESHVDWVSFFVNFTLTFNLKFIVLSTTIFNMSFSSQQLSIVHALCKFIACQSLALSQLN